MALVSREIWMVPLMAERSASIQSCCNRQWLTGRGEERVAPGGKSRQALAEVVDEDGGKEFAVEVALGKSWVSGSELVEVEQGLEPLECDLDLPAQAIELECIDGRQEVALKVGDDRDEVRAGEASRTHRATLLDGLVANPPPLLLGRCR